MLFDIFLKAAFSENLLTWYAVGLGVLVLFSYNFTESIWVSVRFVIFLFIQTLIMLLIRPIFNFPGKDIFMIIFLIGTEVILGIFLDVIIPQSHLEEGLSGFIRRSDVILPMALAIIISKQYPFLETLVYSFGLSIGYVSVLIIITALSIKFSFHRLHPYRNYALKLFILGVLAMIFQ